MNLPVESNDDAVLRMLGGANFASGSRVVLPSGREISGDEAQAFTAVFQEDNRDSNSRSADDTDNPLSSVNDKWTDDPEVNRAMLVARARHAAIWYDHKRDQPRQKPSFWQRLFGRR